MYIYKPDLFLSQTKRQSAFRPVLQFYKFKGNHSDTVTFKRWMFKI